MTSLRKNKDVLEPLICGIDEAGRGPVLGSLVISGVCFFSNDLEFLEDIEVKDSKKLIPTKRAELAKSIRQNCHSYHLIIIDAEEIDKREKQRITLNRLEELKMAEIINHLQPDIIYIDAADTNEYRFKMAIKHLMDYSPQKIISKHKADELFPIVSAASILAKNKRDALIKDLNTNFLEDIGSGYPSDEKTVTFLRNYIRTNKKAPFCARKTWKTTKKILNEEIGNRKITEFFT
ncbi:MAG: ribonuclease HII [Promethearchaeia archaeon]